MYQCMYLHSRRGSVAAQVAGVPSHVEDGDIDADARDVLRDRAQEQEEGRQGPQRQATVQGHVALLPSLTQVAQVSVISDKLT